MRHLLSILAALAILAAPAAAQTVKVLAYDTNGRVLYSDTNTLTFTNALNFSNAATTRANLGFSTNLNTLWTATNSSNARSAVGLGLAALTNTSNVTAIRALAGSTNANHPFSGQFNVIDDNSITFTIVVSNGIIVSATEY